MAFDSKNLALLEPGNRKGEFREKAREIVSHDRECRKYGRTVDTAGAVTRAMEAAYKLGLAHGAAPGGAASQAAPVDAGTGQIAPIAWLTIPPRPRPIFESIMMSEWIVKFMPNATPWRQEADRWACYAVRGDGTPDGAKAMLIDTYSRTTLEPLVKLGLMQEEVFEGSTYLKGTPLGVATIKAAISAGHISTNL